MDSKKSKLRHIHLVTHSDAFKAVYWDRERSAMRPNLVFVHPDGSIAFETNEVGLKGDPIDPVRKLVVVWGDSVVFGGERSWPCLLDALAPGYQFLNGGLDGDPFANILRRAREFNLRQHITLNLVMLGWHPFVPSRIRLRRRWFGLHRKPESVPHRGNEHLRAELTQFLEAVPNTVVLTVPTALNWRIVDRDISSLFVDGPEDVRFSFLPKIPYQMAGQRQGLEHITERNAVAREVCARLGVPVVDLYAAFDTENAADFRAHFIDLIHFRPTSYPLVARAVHDAIKDLLI